MTIHGEFTINGLKLEEDLEVLWKFTPNQSVLSTDDIGGQVIPTRYTIDSDGCRGVREPTTRGVLFLGCSVAFGSGIDDWNTLPHLVQHKLRVPCINAAVPGYGPFQCSKVWRRAFREKEVLGVVWQKPSVYRFPYTTTYSPQTWWSEASHFYNLQWSDRGLWRRFLNQSIAREVAWITELGIACADLKVPFLMCTHETQNSPEERVAIEEVARVGLVVSLSSCIRAAFNRNSDPEEGGFRDLCTTDEDGHPNQLYNEIVSDVVVSHLRRPLRGGGL
jgi:hypothetical protein